MNNIRKDNTKLSKEQKSKWELDILSANSNDENRKQEELLRAWQFKYSRERTPAQLAESELERRISASSDPRIDNNATRTAEVKKKLAIENKVDQAIRNKTKLGQSEEEFQQELEGFGSFYKKIVKKAVQEVNNE